MGQLDCRNLRAGGQPALWLSCKVKRRSLPLGHHSHEGQVATAAAPSGSLKRPWHRLVRTGGVPRWAELGGAVEEGDGDQGRV